MKKNLPFLSGLSFIAVSVAVIEYFAIKKTGGHFCYPLDDTFIHMAVSKNLALYGNWGITPAGFVSTSSSPLFTILLAFLFKLFSVNILMPFVLSCAGTVLMLLAIQEEFNKHTALSTTNKIVCILATMLAGTVPALTLLGMEHTLQIAFVLFFVHSVATLLTNPQKNNIVKVGLWCALMTITRYESVFLVAGAFALLLWQKKIKEAIIIAVAGAIPLLIFGLYSKMHGSYFIPNSVLIKGNQSFKYFLNGGTALIQGTGAFSGLVVIAIIIAVKKLQAKKFDRDFYILSMFIIACLMHAVLVAFSWFYRYEAYLIVLGTLHISKIGLQWLQENGTKALRQQWIPAVLLAAILYSVPVRGLNAFRNSIRAIYNTYEQQYQMGLFFQQYYKEQTVAANDIGAITFMGNLNTIDMWGLANFEIAKARKNGYWNNEFIRKIVADNKTRVAVMYDSWFDKDLTSQWVKVATWKLPFNYVCGDIMVSFYGMNESEANLLKSNLSSFENQLPGDIEVKYFK